MSNINNKKIAVAMSGGVDSSVAAALMVKEYGQENVFGVTMRLFCYGDAEADEKSCCSSDAVNDAKSICDQLGIPHYVVNMEKEFEEAVILDFISEYQKGRTPIPCIPCNAIIKFNYLLKKVESLGAAKVVTGHYARIAINNKQQAKRYQLIKGVDMLKDQSYFLYGLTQEQLSKTLFPLGGMEKSEVRKEAAKLSLRTAKKKESQGICFISEGRVTDWLAGKLENKPGNIVTTEGEIVGQHEGIVFYTVGQRKRIGGGYAEPMYVVRVDASKNEVVIGNKEDLYGDELWYEKAHWIAGVAPKLPLECEGKIRYNMETSPCAIIEIKEDKVKVVFKEPQRAITPGQSVVLYKNEEILGGGIIR